MKVFVINLDNDTERMHYVDFQLKQLGIEYERVSAVYGKALSVEEKNKAVNRCRWWCVVGRPATDGEIGCALSHAGIYRKIIAEKIPIACILEDDVILDKRFVFILQECAKKYSQKSPDIYLLSNHSDAECQIGNNNSGYSTPANVIEVTFKHCMGDFFAEAYILGQEAAKALLEANCPLVSPCDYWGRWAQMKIINLFHVFPTVAHQDKSSFASNTISSSIVPVKQLSLPRFVLHKFLRLFGIIMDKLYLLISK